MTTVAAAEAPLTNYRVVGLRENWYQAAPGAPRQPGGGCWHCGTGIAIEVVISSTVTGETHTIGTTCAERVGLNGPELKAMLARRYAEERAERARRRTAAWRRARDEAEAAATAAHGAHGTESRFLSGCFCEPCLGAAPHGSAQRFLHGRCRCLVCIEGILRERPDEFTVQEDRYVIVELATGRVVEARVVDTTYGRRWCVGDALAWLPVSPARRSTHAKRGYVQARAPFLVEVCGRRGRQWFKPLARMGSPIVDCWGERIVRPASA